MKKIVYFITAFTMLYGLDSEARLPKSQGQMAATLLMKKAGLDINIPTGWTNETHRAKVNRLMGNQPTKDASQNKKKNKSRRTDNIKNETYKFIIDTIYTTDGRNNFAKWMKETYQKCTYTYWQQKSDGQITYNKPDEKNINNYNQVREWKNGNTCYYDNLQCNQKQHGYIKFRRQCQGKTGNEWYNLSYPDDNSVDFICTTNV